MRTKTYTALSRPLCWAVLLMLGFLFSQMIRQELRDQAVYELTASLPEGELTEELLSQMEKLPGFCSRAVLFCTDAVIRVDSYSASVQIRGIDLASCPLNVTRSAGKKAKGSRPLLVVGEGFFAGLSDEYGKPISDRQAELLAQRLDTLTAQVVVEGQDSGSETEFLAIVEGEGIYMDAEQMRLWLGQQGMTAHAGMVELKIRGEKNAARAEETLEGAGLLVEKSPSLEVQIR